MKTEHTGAGPQDFIQSAYTNNRAAVEANLLILMASALSGRLQAWRRAKSERRAAQTTFKKVRDELNGMTDRDLADIGIKRGMIDAIAREAAV